MSETEKGTIEALLREVEELKDRPELREPVARIFDYTKFLLDNDDHLTPSGNLNVTARELLRARIRESFGIEEAPAGEEVAGE